MKRKEDILDVRHWKFPDYRQRITTKQWKRLLLNGGNFIIYRGDIVPIVAKNLGCGVYEIKKGSISKR